MHKREQQDLQRTKDVIALVTARSCISRGLAKYFGDNSEGLPSECGHCSWCETHTPVVVSPREIVSEERAAIGRVLDAVPERDDPRFLARIAFGIKSPRITALKYANQTFFGSLQQHDFPVSRPCIMPNFPAFLIPDRPWCVSSQQLARIHHQIFIRCFLNQHRHAARRRLGVAHAPSHPILALQHPRRPANSMRRRTKRQTNGLGRIRILTQRKAVLGKHPVKRVAKAGSSDDCDTVPERPVLRYDYCISREKMRLENPLSVCGWATTNPRRAEFQWGEDLCSPLMLDIGKY